MTLEVFKKSIYKIREFVNKASEVEKLTGFNWTESFIGDLFDVFYDVMIPGATDEDFEAFGDLLFANEIKDDDIENVWELYKESLE